MNFLLISLLLISQRVFCFTIEKQDEIIISGIDDSKLEQVVEIFLEDGPHDTKIISLNEQGSTNEQLKFQQTNNETSIFISFGFIYSINFLIYSTKVLRIIK